MNIDKKLLKEFGDNKLFTVTFIKKDGSVRHMTCRNGVKKHLNPNSRGMSEAQLENLELNNILRVFEMPAGQYRSIPCDRLLEIKGHGYKFSRESIDSPEWKEEVINA
jgi:hypothetical protein